MITKGALGPVQPHPGGDRLDAERVRGFGDGKTVEHRQFEHGTRTRAVRRRSAATTLCATPKSHATALPRSGRYV
ncbi:hypothetical protein [Actinophytocola sp. KF-1]